MLSKYHPFPASLLLLFGISAQPFLHQYSGKIYHVEFNPAESEEVESRLVQRADDTAEKLKERLANYKAQIDAVSGSFQEVLVNIDGNQSKGEVSAAIEAALGGSNAEADSAEADVDGETAIEGEKAEETGKNEGEEGEDGAESGAADEFAMDDMLGDMAMIVDEVEEDGDALAGGEEGESLGEEDEDLTSANVFAITVFCVDEAFETRIKDFLPAAFEVFPEREYCLVSTACVSLLPSHVAWMSAVLFFSLTHSTIIHC